ncbi:Eco57I restriction-modification methylase domain-containing protein [Mucilaginibacter sp. AW1-3]
MTISPISLIDSIDKAFRLVKPGRTDLDTFKANLQKLLSRIDEKESEENVKGHLADFLKQTYYDPNHLIATKGRADLVIHLEKEAKSHVGVLFEVKKPSNKADMITKNNLNAKAMHELILYFFRERVTNKNISLTHLVITNIYEWFVFDASLFDRVFARNSQLQKTFREWEAGQKVSTKTDLFYNEIAKPFLHDLEEELKFTYVNLKDHIKYLKTDDTKNDNKLVPLYKFFSPVNFLKLPFINDSNSLDTGFFKELLHIIGLEEVKEGGKKVIQRLPVGKRLPASLLENAINMLDVEDVLRKVPNNLLVGKTTEEQLFNLALELSITWVNRILFLKLLEAQLIKYHNGNLMFKFLNIQTINDYNELHKLFFQVLARQTDHRALAVQQKYNHIPYLNSSLFEASPIEEYSIRINTLDHNLDIELYSNSVLTKKRNKSKVVSSMNTLHYFFDFLEAYDFASVGKEEVQEENKTIINAAVLGLVFEKMNGYRDGSIYTPGAVTMFLCRETIRKAVVQKFNETYSWKCETVEDIKNYISDRKNRKDILEFNSVIESIRIADPAVGSGHFLVSSLNELIAIKAQLGILADDTGDRLSDVEVSIANDELVVTYRDSSFFEYTVTTTTSGGHKIAPEVQRIQQTLFNEKRKIIEGSLFGVDINPNSVKICQLRLWIELLKHAYYRPDENFTQLETLPNIDINIKHGNSLLSKYSLKEDLSDVFKKQKFGVADYQLAVEAYKDASDKDAKAKLLDFIKNIKEQFKETVSRRDPKRKRLSELRGQLALAQNNFDLFGAKRTQKEMEIEVDRLTMNIEKNEKEIKEIEENVIYRNAFEWRFEFPEVLSEKGDFEGFEVIIGNPPYIQLQKMGEDADALQKGNYATFTRTGDIYCLFYEQAIRLLKPSYFFGFITSNKWMRANYGVAIRKFFLEETNPLLLVDFGGYQVFESATVDTNMLISQKATYAGETQTCLLDKSLGSLEKMSDYLRQHTNTVKGFSDEGGWVILSEIETRIKAKIESIGTPLKHWNVQINYGIKTGFNEAFIIDQVKRDELLKNCPEADEIIRPLIRGRGIGKYYNNLVDSYLIFTRKGINIEKYLPIKNYLMTFYEDLLPKNNKELRGRKPGTYQWYEIQDNIAYWKEFEKPKIVWKRVGSVIRFSYDETGMYCLDSTCFAVGKDLKYIVGYLNSTFSKKELLRNSPQTGTGDVITSVQALEPHLIPRADSVQKNAIATLVDQCITVLQKDEFADISAYERQIDSIIADLFQLTIEEKEVIGFIEIQ